MLAQQLRGRQPRAPNAPPVPQDLWEHHRLQIELLYIRMDMTLEHLMAFMQLEHGFSPSIRQYTKQLNSWGLRKYRSGCDSAPRAANISERSRPSLHEPIDGTVVAVYHDKNTDEGFNDKICKSDLSPGPKTSDTRDFIHIIDDSLAITENLFEVSGLGDSQVPFPGSFFEEDAVMGESLDTIKEEWSDSSISEGSTTSARILSRPDGIIDRSHKEAKKLPDMQQISDQELDVLHPIERTGYLRNQSANLATSETIERSQDQAFPVQPSEAPRIMANEPMASTIERYVPYTVIRTSQLLGTVSTTGLLPAAELSRSQTKHSARDLTGFEKLGEFYSCAGLHEDAFQLFHLIASTRIADFEDGNAQADAALLRDVLNVARTATTPADCARVAHVMRNTIAKSQAILTKSSIQTCLLHSYLGGDFSVQKDIRSAENYCRFAIKTYEEVKFDSISPVHQPILVTNLLMILEQKTPQTCEILDEISELKCRQVIVAEGWASRKVSSALFDISIWCSAALADEEFSRIFLHVNEDVWNKAPWPEELADCESTILLCYLWRRWHDDRQRHKSAYSQHQNICDIALSIIWELYDIPPLETLAVVARMILGTNSGGESSRLTPNKSTLAIRASDGAQQIERLRDLRSPLSLIEGYVVQLRKKGSRFSTDEYALLVRDFVRSFVQAQCDLRLSASWSQAPTAGAAPIQAFSTTSISQTITSTPHSSWSGWRSFTSLSRRISTALRSSEELESYVSGRRLSRLSSWRRSGASFFSTAASSQDVAMEDSL